MNYGMVMLLMLNISKIFGSRCYILKDHRNGKIDAKSDEGIFLGYSTKRKSYNCLNSNTNKVVESENVRVDEFAERDDTSCNGEPKEYITFIYVDDDSPNTQSEHTIQATSFHQTGNDGMQM